MLAPYDAIVLNNYAVFMREVSRAPAVLAPKFKFPRYNESASLGLRD